jgi:hypothetical protein
MSGGARDGNGGRSHANSVSMRGIRSATIQRTIDSSGLTLGAFPKAFEFLKQAVQRTQQGRELWNLCSRDGNTNLIFQVAQDVQATDSDGGEESKKKKNTIYAQTNLYVGSKERDLNTFNICDQLTENDRNAKVDIVIQVSNDIEKAADLGVCAETLVHEFAIHATNYTQFVSDLRDGTDIYEIQDRLQTQLDDSSPEAILSKDVQHYQLATQTSIPFNVLIEEVYRQMVGSGRQDAAASLKKEVVKDVADHVKFETGTSEFMYGQRVRERNQAFRQHLCNEIEGAVQKSEYLKTNFAKYQLNLDTLETERLVRLGMLCEKALAMSSIVKALKQKDPVFVETLERNKVDYLQLNMKQLTNLFNASGFKAFRRKNNL